MNSEFDLTYSKDALLSRVLFLASKTELNIFVEDADKEYEYEEIFERLLPKGIKINCIFPTGGKKELEVAFSLFGSNIDYGKCFFIADGDFDIILGKRMIVADNFIYLKRYNIESYFLHKNTILKYMRPKLKRTIKETAEIIQYDNWLNIVTPYFKKLFSLHCVVQKYHPETINVARGAEQFLDKDGFPNEISYERYKDEISEFVSNIDVEINTMLASLEATYGSDSSNYVCGKCFISSLKSMLNSKIKKKMNCDELKAVLLSGFDITSLSYVKDKLIFYLSI